MAKRNYDAWHTNNVLPRSNFCMMKLFYVAKAHKYKSLSRQGTTIAVPLGKLLFSLAKPSSTIWILHFLAFEKLEFIFVLLTTDLI